MRSFFVTWMERLLGLLVLLSAIGIAVGVWTIATSGMPQATLRAVIAGLTQP